MRAKALWIIFRRSYIAHTLQYSLTHTAPHYTPPFYLALPLTPSPLLPSLNAHNIILF